MLHRPRSIVELKDVMNRSSSPEGNAAAGALKTHPSDVFISTFAKSGTTWMQQIVHQLRSNADEGYDDIYDVVPWLEMALVMKIDPAAPQSGDFRAFKTHLSYAGLPKPGRYISIFRNPRSVIPSFYRFLGGWYFETDAISLDEFAREIYMPTFTSHKDHFLQWFERMGKDDTLLLSYEDMVLQPESVPVVVAQFLELSPTAEIMNTVVRQSSRQYMLEHSSKFGDRLVKHHQDAQLQLPPSDDSMKVHESQSKAKLSSSVLEQIDELWASCIESTLGFKNYNELRQALPNPLDVTR